MPQDYGAPRVYYEPTTLGYEKTIKAWLEHLERSAAPTEGKTNISK